MTIVHIIILYLHTCTCNKLFIVCEVTRIASTYGLRLSIIYCDHIILKVKTYSLVRPSALYLDFLPEILLFDHPGKERD